MGQSLGRQKQCVLLIGSIKLNVLPCAAKFVFCLEKYETKCASHLFGGMCWVRFDLTFRPPVEEGLVCVEALLVATM